MRIASNLVANAVRHTESGRVSVSSKRSQGQLAIEITDTGPGMDPHQLKTLSARYEKGSSAELHRNGCLCKLEAAAHKQVYLTVP